MTRQIPVVYQIAAILTYGPQAQRHPGTTETTLYAPVKRYLEALGFTAKGEVCGCDLVALRGDEPPIVVVGELKLAFSLELVLCDGDPRVYKLCRLLGFGLLGVSCTGSVEALVEPKPWRPRRDTRRRARLVQEHRSRIGDPAPGGSTKLPIMAAYRQQALACASSLAGGPRRTSEIRSAIPVAPSILLRNVTGAAARVGGPC